MPFEPMSIAGAYVYIPTKHFDNRGSFQENFKLSVIKEELGIDFQVKQVNQSVSRKGVIRGIHFAKYPPGQAKYVSCPKGSIWDVVVDLRIDSPTFGKWEGVELSEENGKSVLIPANLGHAFLSLEDDSVVNYMCSEEFNPATEYQIYPFDSDLAVSFASFRSRLALTEFLLSKQDSAAKSLQSSVKARLLPS